MLISLRYCLIEQNGPIFQFSGPIPAPIDKLIKIVYTGANMDIKELQERYGEDWALEATNEDIVTDNDIKTLMSEREKRIRKMEIAAWAEKNGVFKHAPKMEVLEPVWVKLKNGVRLMEAIKGICSFNTWNTWRKEYPAILAMEEQCREERIAMLQREMMQIADQSDRTRMGESTRDKLMIDVRQKEIDRLDRLTEIRMQSEGNKKQSAVVPIQINVAYGRENKTEVINAERVSE